MAPSIPIKERFEKHIIPVTECGCWLWYARINTLGYGSFKVDGKTALAHRVSWAIYRGEITDSLDVLHKCDVRSCVNPDHLFLGTHSENMYDMAKKGRAAKKLDTETVLAIRASHPELSIHRLTQKYGMSSRAIQCIVERKTWRHI